MPFLLLYFTPNICFDWKHLVIEGIRKNSWPTWFPIFKNRQAFWKQPSSTKTVWNLLTAEYLQLKHRAKLSFCSLQTRIFHHFQQSQQTSHCLSASLVTSCSNTLFREIEQGRWLLGKRAVSASSFSLWKFMQSCLVWIWNCPFPGPVT